jgi:SHS family lactate transporter-like MFS transporter
MLGHGTEADASVDEQLWDLGALLSSAAYGLPYDDIGWRGLLLIGVLPALVIVSNCINGPE